MRQRNRIFGVETEDYGQTKKKWEMGKWARGFIWGVQWEVGRGLSVGGICPLAIAISNLGGERKRKSCFLRAKRLRPHLSCSLVIRAICRMALAALRLD